MAVAMRKTDPQESFDFDIRMMRVNGQSLRVGVLDGPSGPPPLLLFNGIGASMELGFPFLSALKGRRAIIFDVPGVGGSPTPTLPYRPQTVARWAKGVCQQLGHDLVDVSGVSWGGGVAQQFTRQYPRRVRKLVLVATSSGFTMVPGKPSVLTKMASIRRYTDKGYMREIAADIYGGDFRTDPTLIQRHSQAAKPLSNLGYLYQLLAMTGWTSVPWLWTIRQPTLVLSGDDDPLIPAANASLLASLIPNSRLEILQNGHLFLVTRPEESAEIIEAFLDKE